MVQNAVEIHLFNSRFKEHIGDANGARAALVQCDTKSNSGFIENVVALANLERRLVCGLHFLINPSFGYGLC